ncbi:conserved protein, unknown function [Hepatocystis sp. ex Piliocolobus tephrosceles]|nr:conserved protein, unknown function [Hepatocystis sp. ex Piliocolobus tephrosceles]
MAEGNPLANANVPLNLSDTQNLSNGESSVMQLARSILNTPLNTTSNEELNHGNMTVFFLFLAVLIIFMYTYLIVLRCLDRFFYGQHNGNNMPVLFNRNGGQNGGGGGGNALLPEDFYDRHRG